jgi:N-acetyl-anhydromuramyl-L-alanine amidase AmpD
MREIKRLIIHCAATKPDMDIGVEEIREWHKERGWKDIGYHFVIRRTGEIEKGRPVSQVGAHAKGHNLDSIGICLVGGIDEDGDADANFTFEQYVALEQFVDEAEDYYGDLDVLGHRDLPGVAKACPCFDVTSFLENLQ